MQPVAQSTHTYVSTTALRLYRTAQTRQSVASAAAGRRPSTALTDPVDLQAPGMHPDWSLCVRVTHRISTIVIMTVRSRAAAPVQLVLHAPTGYVRGRCVARDYFSPVSSKVGHRGKIVPGSAGAVPVPAHPVLLGLLGLLWGSRARG